MPLTVGKADSHFKKPLRLNQVFLRWKATRMIINFALDMTESKMVPHNQGIDAQIFVWELGSYSTNFRGNDTTYDHQITQEWRQKLANCNVEDKDGLRIFSCYCAPLRMKFSIHNFRIHSTSLSQGKICRRGDKILFFLGDKFYTRFQVDDILNALENQKLASAP